jgi:AcrR family transcriptional regulator
VPADSHRTKPEHGVETRAALVRVARDLFAERGYHAVALESVCTAAGVTRGALYHHFAGKEELFKAVCEELATEVSAHLVAVAAKQPDPAARLRAGCLAFVDACGDPAVRQILLSDAPSVLGWQMLREIDGRHGLGLLKSTLQAAADSGAIMPLPVDIVAHLLVAALTEAAMVTHTAGNPTRARQDARTAIQRILDGVAASPKAGHSR